MHCFPRPLQKLPERQGPVVENSQKVLISEQIRTYSAENLELLSMLICNVVFFVCLI